MAGDHAELEQFKGWQKYYNTFTVIGRRNVSLFFRLRGEGEEAMSNQSIAPFILPLICYLQIALSTYAMIALGALYYKFGRKSPPKTVDVAALEKKPELRKH
jgi:ATP synthase regulation